MPYLAIDECLKETGLSLSDIDNIAIGWNPYLGWITRSYQSLKSIKKSPDAYTSKLSRSSNYLTGIKNIFRLRNMLKIQYGANLKIPSVKYVPHHLAHAASAFYCSPYDEANIIVADGVGEAAALSLYTADGRGINKIKQFNYPNSLGHIYAAVTGFLGFKMTSDEGKVMALAGFGEDTYSELFSDLVEYDTDKKMLTVDILLLDYHQARENTFSSDWINRTRLVQRKKNEELTSAHFNLAASLQKSVEKIVLSILEDHFGQKNKNLVAAGGLFLNSVMNGEIVRKFSKEFFVQPAAGDNGVSLGSALYTQGKKGAISKSKKYFSAFLGNSFSGKQIENKLVNEKIKFTLHSDINKKVCELIYEGKIVAWFQSKMEFGPRALGNRSILTSVHLPKMKEVLNRRVKHREPFRPFACCILLEDAAEYFEHITEAPYMLKVFYFKEKYRKSFPAITHVDYSCRLQTVTEEQNPKLYNLLLEYKKISGHGILLNTSLNDNGQPILQNPDEAIDLIRKTDLDYLAIDNFLISKKKL